MRMNQDNALQVTVSGSLRDVAEQQGLPLQEAFLGARVVVIFDSSASMSLEDSRGGRQRYEVAREELHRLQAQHPGQIALFAFSSEVIPVPGGDPPYLGASTDLADALRMVKLADTEGMKFIVISDGEPDSEQEALEVAESFKNVIHGVFAGSESDNRGRQFLESLTGASGGTSRTAHRAVDLLDEIEMLLLEA